MVLVADNEARPPNGTQEVRASASVERFQRAEAQAQAQAQAQDMPAAATREFRSSQTLTSGDVIPEADVKCGCGAHPLRPPPPPPIPPELLQRLFPGQHITPDLLAKRGFRERVQQELRALVRREESAGTTRPQQRPQESRQATSPPALPLPPAGRQSEPVQASPSLGQGGENHHPPRATSAPKAKGRTVKVKVIDLMKNWRSLTDVAHTAQTSHYSRGKKGGSEEEEDVNEREIVRQMAMEFTKPRQTSARTSGVDVVATNVFTCTSCVFLPFTVISLQRGLLF